MPVGRDILVGVSDAVSSVIGYGQNGIEFLFGGLVGNKMFEVFGGGSFVFAFRVLPVIFLLFPDRGTLLPRHHAVGDQAAGRRSAEVLGASRAESLSATANIFVGQTEAPLVVHPSSRDDRLRAVRRHVVVWLPLPAPCWPVASMGVRWNT